MYYITIGKHKTRVKFLDLSEAKTVAYAFRKRYGNTAVCGEPEFATSEFFRSHKEVRRAVRLLTLLRDSYKPP